MPTFTVSLMASIPISAKVVVDADNESDAIIQATQMQSRSQLTWTYGGLPIPAYKGPVTSIWSNTGVVPPPGPKQVSVVLQVFPTTVVFNSPVSATVTVAPGATGAVTFYNGLIVLGTVIPNGLGVASLSNISLAVGIQNIHADFAGDLYFAAGVSNSVLVTVNPSSTSTSINASPNPQNFGNQVRISSTVTSSAGIPTGLVIFYDGGLQIGAAALSGGNAFINLTTLSTGTHMLKAMYQGNADFSNSTSSPFTQTIE